jgi:hypothetical protein
MRGLSTLVFYQYSIQLSIENYHRLNIHRCRQGSHVRVSMMQLSFIELIHISAQPLHKGKGYKEKT